MRRTMIGGQTLTKIAVNNITVTVVNWMRKIWLMPLYAARWDLPDARNIK